MVVGDGTEDGVVGIDESRGTSSTSWRMKLAARATSVHDDTGDTHAAAPRRISQETGWHDAKLLPGGRAYLDLWSSPEQPPTASLRNLDGKVEHWLVRNALDVSHPYQPCSSPRDGGVRLAAGERRTGLSTTAC